MVIKAQSSNQVTKITVKQSRQNLPIELGQSAQHFNNLSELWAISPNIVENKDYSSKYYAEKSKESETKTENYERSVIEKYNSFVEASNQAETELQTLRDNSISQINTVTSSGISDIANKTSEAVTNLNTNIETATSEINNVKNNAVAQLSEEAQEQLKNIESTGFYMRDDKLYFINSKGEEKEFKSGGGSGGASLPIGFIGQTTVPIDESLGLQRYANGSQLSINANTEEFVATIEKWAQFYPSMVASSQEEWNTIRSLSDFGQCGKYFIDRENGYIQLPLVINAQGLGDLTNFSNIKPQTLPNVGGYLNEVLTSSATNMTSGALTRTITAIGGNNGGDYARNVCDISLNASQSSSVYQDGAPVQQEAVMYPYFIQIASGATTTIDITNEIELNNPYFLGKSEYFEIQPDNLSWKKGGTTVTFAEYPTFYEKVVKAYNGTETVEGMSVKSIDEVYTDFDYVLDLANEQFRLPLLNGSECVPSDKKVEMELKPNNNKYVAPANGWFAVQKNCGVNNGYIYLWDEDNNLVNEWISTASNYMSKVELYVPKGHTVRVGYNLTGNLIFFGFIYAKGNGTLYYYVGETAQNANLINVPRIIENKADIHASNFSDAGKSTIAHMAMPSLKYTNLTVGTSGTTYTMPADGYLYVYALGGGVSFYGLYNITRNYGTGNVANGSGYNTQFMLPVNKNDVVRLEYQIASSNFTLKFLYANGSESEAN
jgi:hypothetical protein